VSLAFSPADGGPETATPAGLAAGRVKGFEERGVKPYPATRARLAKVLRAPDLERFGEERET
jgi:hypothetical protein